QSAFADWFYQITRRKSSFCLREGFFIKERCYKDERNSKFLSKLFSEDDSVFILSQTDINQGKVWIFNFNLLHCLRIGVTNTNNRVTQINTIFFQIRRYDGLIFKNQYHESLFH